MEVDYFEESVLYQKMQDENRDMLWFIEHHSDELREEYTSFCEERDIDVSSPSSAISFMEYRESLLVEPVL